MFLIDLIDSLVEYFYNVLLDVFGDFSPFFSCVIVSFIFWFPFFLLYLKYFNKKNVDNNNDDKIKKKKKKKKKKVKKTRCNFLRCYCKKKKSLTLLVKFVNDAHYHRIVLNTTLLSMHHVYDLIKKRLDVIVIKKLVLEKDNVLLETDDDLLELKVNDCVKVIVYI